jgi:hypothetical protein
VNDADNNWAEANQRYLMAHVAAVREALAAHASKAGSGTDRFVRSAEDSLVSAAEAMPSPPALDALCSMFG